MQFVKVLVEKTEDIDAGAAPVVAQRGAPCPFALGSVRVVEKIGKAGDQVGLRENHVDRRMHAQALGQFLDARAQVLRQFQRRFRRTFG